MSRSKRPRLSQAESDAENSSDEGQELLRSSQLNQFQNKKKQKRGEDTNGGYVVNADLNERSYTAQSGVIEDVTLTDFMCHSKVATSLGPRMNFLIGHNGSGKSAILTAITLALGGKASATQRGNSLKGFIKEGRTSAEVKLRLLNRGEDAYEHETYGDYITIVRRINKEGSASYKLQSTSGKTISTRAGDLTKITDHFSIQPDNPINVLSQDQARGFLNSSDPKTKYNFFLKGTQLSQLMDDYNMLASNIERAQALVRSKKEQLPDLYKEYRDAENEYEQAVAARDQETRLDDLVKEESWSHVAEKRKELQAHAEKMTKHEEKIPELENEYKLALENVTICEEEIQKLENDSNTEGKEVEYEQEANELNTKLKEIKYSVKDIHNQRRDININLGELQSRIEEFDRKIAEEERKIAASRGGIHEKLSNEIYQLRENIKGIKEEIQRYEFERDSKDQEYNNNRDSFSMAQQNAQKARTNLDEAKNQRAYLERQRKDNLLAYGDKIPQILKDIDRQQWQDKPLGPLGRYVKLKHSKWAPIIEAIFRDTLNSFVVTNGQDRQKLIRILQQNQARHDIITRRPDPSFDCSQHEPDEKFLTILRALDISNSLAREVLINASGIETSVLIEDRHQAEEAIRNSANRNISSVYLPTGYEIKKIGGMVRMNAMEQYKGRPRLFESFESEARRADENIKMATDELQRATHEKTRIDGILGDIHEKKVHFTKKISMCKRILSEKEDALRNKEGQLHEDEPASLAAFVESKKDAEKDMESYKQTDLELEKQVLLLTQSQEPLLRRREELKTLLDDLHESQQNKVHKIERAAKRHGHAQAKADQLKQEQQNANKISEELNKIFSNLESEYVETTTNAESVWPDGESHLDEIMKKTPADYAREIKSLERSIEDSKKRLGRSVEVLAEDLAIKKQKYQESKQSVDALNEIIKMLKDGHKGRCIKWDLFRNHIGIRARMQFLRYLSNRGFAGTLKFNHEKRVLDIHIMTDTHHGRSKDAKSLSGGEKSFSTICLLLSLWEAIGCPIRCLDEFDVFMDAVNRKISMDMMIATAKDTLQTQFLFITPQAMGNVDFGNDVRICKLQDPKRLNGQLAAA